MADFVFKISPNIILGSYAATRIGQFVQEWGTKFMVLMDPILHESGVAAKIKQSLTDRKVDFFVFDEIPNAPDTSVIENALKLAKEVDADVIMATDPDADRVGIAVKENDEYVLLTGNQVGILLTDYIAKTRKELGTLPENPIMVKSIVTSYDGSKC